MLKHGCIIIALLFITKVSFAQDSLKQNIFVDTFQSAQFLANIESSLFDYYSESWGQEKAYAIIDELGYESKEVITFSDSIYINRLQYITDISPFTSAPNNTLLKTVKYFVTKRKRFTSVIIGRSKLYFPMFESYLTKYNLPLELKYLPVIESALKPNGKSWAGATGLWQIMYRTGRSLGLYSDSYVDDRLHPEKSTDAACRYLKYLFSLYGDWDMALAAYNAGPGNVNKAIRRSGGKTDFWAIRPFLPKETQMYVPNFYAVMYMMTFYPEHNIIPVEANLYLHETDTICLKQSIRISHLDSIIGLKETDFRKLNPQYKTDIIPLSIASQCIVLPINMINKFLLNEDSLYQYQSYLDSTGNNYIILEKMKTHKVLPSETLASISKKYQVSPADIREWNGLRNSTIYPGQKLIYMVEQKRHLTKVDQSKVKITKKPVSKPKITSSGNYKYYTLKSGESLWVVSQKLGISFVELQELNKGLNPKKMKPGQKIIIGTK